MVTGTELFHGPAFGALLNERDTSGWQEAGLWEPGVEPIADAAIVGIWDPDRAAAEKLAGLLDGVAVVDDCEDLIGQVDGVLVVDDGTQQHQKFAEPFLRAGVPTFIDKPLSRDWEEAAAIIDLAEESGAPLMSCSALRFAREIDEARERIEEISPIRLATAIGPNELIYYGVHPAELFHTVLGPGIESVRNVGRKSSNLVRVKYHDDRYVMLCVFEEIGYVFQLNLYGEKGCTSIEVSDAAAFYKGMLEAAVRMFRTGESPVPTSSTLEIIKTLHAAELSRETSQTVLLSAM